MQSAHVVHQEPEADKPEAGLLKPNWLTPKPKKVITVYSVEENKTKDRGGKRREMEPPVKAFISYTVNRVKSST